MATRRRRTLTLDDAAREAWRLALIRDNYFSLSHSERDTLRELMALTQWRPSASATRRGLSPLQAFFHALDARHPPVVRSPEIEHGQALYRHALDLLVDDPYADGPQEAADTMDVAADLLNLGGDYRGAAMVSQNARTVRRDGYAARSYLLTIRTRLTPR